MCDKKKMMSKCRRIHKRPNSPFYVGLTGMLGYGLIMIIYFSVNKGDVNDYYTHRNKEAITFFGFYAIGELVGRALRAGYLAVYPPHRPKAVHVANLPRIDNEPVGNYIVSSTLSDYFSEPTDWIRRYRMPLFMGMGFAGLFGFIAFCTWVHSLRTEGMSHDWLFEKLTDSGGASAFFTCLTLYAWFNIPIHGLGAIISYFRSRQENAPSFGREPVLPYDSDIFDTDRMRSFSPYGRL